MTTSQSSPGERVADVRFDDDTMSVDMVDGPTITVPLAWYPRLLDAASKPAGELGGLVWADTESTGRSLTEDLSTQGLLEGAPALRHPQAAKP